MFVLILQVPSFILVGPNIFLNILLSNTESFWIIWRRGNTQKNKHNIQNTAKVWNQEYVKKICKNWNWLTNIKRNGNATRLDDDDDDDYEHRCFNRNKQHAWKLHKRIGGKPVRILQLDKFICSEPVRRCTTVYCEFLDTRWVQLRPSICTPRKHSKGLRIKLHLFLTSPLEWSELSTGWEPHSWSEYFWQDKNRLFALLVIELLLFGGPALSLFSMKEGILHELSTEHHRPNSNQYLFPSTFIRIALFPRTNKQWWSVRNRYMPQCCYLVSTTENRCCRCPPYCKGFLYP